MYYIHEAVFTHHSPHSRLPSHRLRKPPHRRPIKRIRSAYRVRIKRVLPRARGVDVEARPVHAASDGGRVEDVRLIAIQDVADVEVGGAIHAELFEDAGFVRGGAGGVVVLEPLEAVGGALGSVVFFRFR